MKKALEIGKDYGFAFGLDPKVQGTLVYNGGDSWTATDKASGRTMTMDSAKQTSGALEYINRPSVTIGSLR